VAKVGFFGKNQPTQWGKLPPRQGGPLCEEGNITTGELKEEEGYVLQRVATKKREEFFRATIVAISDREKTKGGKRGKEVANQWPF